MGLPGHRRTSSHKRRRASHFALTAPTLAVDKKSGQTHRPHRAAPGATEYRGIAIHVKGQTRKMAKLLAKTKPHTHDEHEGHDHAHEHKAQTPKTKTKPATKKPAKSAKKSA